MKLLFFDIDGTLFNNKKNEIPASTKQALSILHSDKETKLFIATGRSTVFLDSLKPVIDLFDGVISINGSYITYQNKVVFSNFLNDKQKKEIISVLEKYNLNYGYQAYNREAINVYTKDILRLFNELSLQVPDYEKDIESIDNISQMYFFGSNKEIDIVKDELPDYKVLKWYDGGADILTKNISKYLAIKHLQNYFLVADSDVYCFGDGTNDYEMVKNFKNSVCMGNGVDELKEVAGFVTKDIGDDGLAYALKHFKLI